MTTEVATKPVYNPGDIVSVRVCEDKTRGCGTNRSTIKGTRDCTVISHIGNQVRVQLNGYELPVDEEKCWLIKRGGTQA